MAQVGNSAASPIGARVCVLIKLWTVTFSCIKYLALSPFGSSPVSGLLTLALHTGQLNDCDSRVTEIWTNSLHWTYVCFANHSWKPLKHDRISVQCHFASSREITLLLIFSCFLLFLFVSIQLLSLCVKVEKNRPRNMLLSFCSYYKACFKWDIEEICIPLINKGKLDSDQLRR